jgi:thioesterase domain-containing protein/acyl carrier protein
VLRQQLREALPDYMVPAAFVQLEALPLMSNGKLNRALLPPASSEDVAGVADEMPSGSIECALASIWKEMLGMDRIGRDQSFFDLGGHSLLAVRMLFRVRQETGLAIPLAVLFQEGSIKGLADWASADRAGRAAQASTLVPIRPHGQHPALFFIPGTLGTSGPFFRLASRLTTPRALYALQPPGMDGRQAPCTSMAQMAQAHVRSLRAVQPSGPYVLCGHSFGGLLAFEVARQLLAENEQVSRVVLLDSDPACQLNPVQETVSPDAVQALLQQVAWLTDGPPGSAQLLVASEPPMSVEDLAVLARVVEAQQSMRHVPMPCAVKLVLIRAEEGGMQGSADAGWRELTPHAVDVHGVAGQHYSMLGQHVDALAHTLDQVLRAIDAEERA